jgi:hypothetical protein
LRLRLRLHVWLAGGDNSKRKCMRAACVDCNEKQEGRQHKTVVDGYNTARVMGQKRRDSNAGTEGGDGRRWRCINEVGSIVGIELFGSGAGWSTEYGHQVCITRASIKLRGIRGVRSTQQPLQASRASELGRRGTASGGQFTQSTKSPAHHVGAW